MTIRKNITVIGVLWLVVIIISFLWNWSGALKEQKKLALFTARSFFKQVVITRQWNAMHGGLYAPVTTTTHPNPYLDVPDRDLQIDSGLMLTKINPAFMTRQISEIAREKNGIQFHITSLKPIRPENRPTNLESAYLHHFENNAGERGEFIKNGEQSYYFYMAPLITRKSCLKCHAKQGYKEGDIRGGISVTLPFKAEIPFNIIVFSHIGIALLGFMGLVIVEKKMSASYQTIKRQAVMDALTGIPNRRSFSESILQAFDRSKREKEPLSVIMCDIDSFKLFNDSYGHTAGDQCLREVASELRSAMKRSGDFCARYGGEEFVVILIDTDLDGALKVAERIRLSIENLQIAHNDSPPANVVTMSLGVAVLSDSSLSSYEELIQHADEALYHSKRLGRNQVQYYQEQTLASS